VNAEDLPGELRRFIAGHFDALPAVSGAEHAALLDAANSGPPLLLTAEAVARVLRAFKATAVTTTQVGDWAFFVWRRYFDRPGVSAAPRPLPLEWEPDHADAILPIVERLDELSDPLADPITDHELEAMLVSLGHPAR
jgi:hypothetical protein